MQIYLHRCVTRHNYRALYLVGEVNEHFVIWVVTQKPCNVLGVKYFWWRSSLLQAGDIDLFEELWPVLVQCQVNRFHQLVLERLRAPPYFPKDCQRVIDAIQQMLLAVHECLCLYLFNLRLRERLGPKARLKVLMEDLLERWPETVSFFSVCSPWLLLSTLLAESVGDYLIWILRKDVQVLGSIQVVSFLVRDV